MLKLLNFHSIKQKVILNSLNFLHKQVCSNGPLYLGRLFERKGEKHRHFLRNNSEWIIGSLKGAPFQSSVFYGGIKLYNEAIEKFKMKPLKNFSSFLSNFVKEKFCLSE